jgi:hypothetical protein
MMRDSTAGRGQSDTSQMQDAERLRIWAEEVEREGRWEQQREGFRKTQPRNGLKDIEKEDQSDGCESFNA